MHLSQRTIDLLTNFSNINNSIYVRNGSVLSTISVTNNIYAKANITEEFLISFAIYDLHEFLVGLRVWDRPDVDFGNTSYVTMSSGRSKVKYFFADPDVVVKPPDKGLNIPNYNFSFNLDSEHFGNLRKLAAIYNLPDLCVETDSNGDVSLVIKDKENETSNAVTHHVGTSETPFSFNFKVENLKLIPSSYTVELSTKAARFVEAETQDLEYFIALEPDSKYGV